MGLGLDGGGVEGVERGGGRAGSGQEDAGRCRRGQQALRPTVHRFRPTFSPFSELLLCLLMFFLEFLSGAVYGVMTPHVSVCELWQPFDWKSMAGQGL